jgi:deoxyribodipyrimidine photolyase-related protein
MTLLSIWIPGDQLLEQHPALERARAEAGSANLHIVMVESARRLGALPWHRQKRVLVLSAMRHYAEWLRAQGYRVDYCQAASMTDGLRAHVAAHQPARLLMMAAAEYPARQAQHSMSKRLGLPVDLLPNTQFLVGQYDPFPGTRKRVIQENFYRAMRRHFNVLMDGAEPAGGQWNTDKDNRKPLPKSVQPPAPFVAEPDAITRQVMMEVEAEGAGIGSLDGFGYAVTHAGARAALADFIAHRLDSFGPYEDAMTTRHSTLYHSVLSPYVNLGLLTPLEIARAAEAAYREGRAALNSVEGFVRQVIGWREYMYWQYWRMMPSLSESNSWGAERPLPPFFWTGDTEMRCLRETIQGALATGYSHHIQRLMLVSNFCVLAGIHPQAVVEWFMSLYIDAYDWVMQPNVVGMGLNADGGVIATKPYIASASYINRMSDYCKGCRFDHTARTGADACPFNTLYWNFLIEHEVALRANPRSGPAVLGLNRLDAEERAAIQAQAAVFMEGLDSA